MRTVTVHPVSFGTTTARTDGAAQSGKGKPSTRNSLVVKVMPPSTTSRAKPNVTGPSRSSSRTRPALWVVNKGPPGEIPPPQPPHAGGGPLQGDRDVLAGGGEAHPLDEPLPQASGEVR